MRDARHAAGTRDEALYPLVGRGGFLDLLIGVLDRRPVVRPDQVVAQVLRTGTAEYLVEGHGGLRPAQVHPVPGQVQRKRHAIAALDVRDWLVSRARATPRMHGRIGRAAAPGVIRPPPGP